jgi:excisionase family DNA binding protein
MLTVEDLAAYLQVPENTVYRWNTRGTGPRPRHVGRHVRYHWRDVEEWVQNGNSPHRVS